jgi:hypothetical protein
LKKRKPAVKRTRRSPYERSLEYATKRLEKATAEQMDCQKRLMALNQEIPYLQTVIRALTPPAEKRVPLQHDPYSPMGAPTIFSSVPSVNPDHFWQKPGVTDNVDEMPSEEDAFLNITIPGEKEVLP